MQTFLGIFPKSWQSDGDRATNATCMKLEKKERVSMCEGKKRKAGEEIALTKNMYTNT